MTHADLVQQAINWLKGYGCGVILSEQSCASGEMPDAIGWKRACHSVLIECKISRADFRKSNVTKEQLCLANWDPQYPPKTSFGAVDKAKCPKGAK